MGVEGVNSLASPQGDQWGMGVKKNFGNENENGKKYTGVNRGVWETCFW
ncbi:MAG: hypothetical protein CM15mV7_2740 [uncultured marine virus]|nr:MAG: hypothetical protein CM15mV7_2740 [uncultured marine virus]